MAFRNTYEDANYAAAYAAMEFPGTYALAFRDLPEIIARHVRGQRALDFGCGAGRSTRFLRRLGFDTVGVDISPEMIRLAREADPAGAYRLVVDGGVSAPRENVLDLILCAFPFDNIPTVEKKAEILGYLASRLAEDGRIVNLVSSPEIYIHEWASFSTKAFPENRAARCGEIVRIINLAVDHLRPTEDIFWPAEAWAETYQLAGLDVVATYQPLASLHEPGPWVNETRIPPWTIYVLGKPTAVAPASSRHGD